MGLRFLIVSRCIQEKKHWKTQRILHRWNPYNPLNLVIIPSLILFAIIMDGLPAFIQEWENPFKWR